MLFYHPDTHTVIKHTIISLEPSVYAVHIHSEKSAQTRHTSSARASLATVQRAIGFCTRKCLFNVTR